ncbi:MAG: hypothetical protein GY710_06220 [Desulfobacteraceae bacterium]|nr:hypothetical protein [Desulfobacteraceae bacterium]
MGRLKILHKINNSVMVRECKGGLKSDCGEYWLIKFNPRGRLERVPIGQIIGFGEVNETSQKNKKPEKKKIASKEKYYECRRKSE